MFQQVQNYFVIQTADDRYNVTGVHLWGEGEYNIKIFFIPAAVRCFEKIFELMLFVQCPSSPLPPQKKERKKKET